MDTRCRCRSEATSARRSEAQLTATDGDVHGRRRGGASAAKPSRDWQTFGQYLCNHRPPLELSRCSGAHVLEFLRYLDQFGKPKVHSSPACPFFGQPSPPAPCPCPLRQAWGSLDALYLRDMAYEKKRRRRHPKQAKLHQEHHQSPAAAVVPLTSLATESRGGVLEPVAPHFLFPHAHFFPGVGGVTGEDVAMAEAHAAG
jgi:hypothetical protein